MIVDDEIFNVIGLTHMLTNALNICFSLKYKEKKLFNNFNIEFIIDKASNGLEALEKVKNSCLSEDYSYAIIFMDCSMPIMDGY